MLPNKADNLPRLVIDGSEPGVDTNRKTVYLDGYDAESLFQQLDKRQEDLVRYTKARYQQKRRRFKITK